MIEESDSETKHNNIYLFFVVFIINDRVCQWEIFNTTDTIHDVYTILQNKYNMDDFIIEINDLFFSKLSRDKLIDISTENCITLRITTKNRQYKLPDHLPV